MRDVVILCPPGFEELVSVAAAHEFPTFTAAITARGFIRARTDAPLEQLRAFPCATNVFAAIADVPRATTEREAQALAERLPD